MLAALADLGDEHPQRAAAFAAYAARFADEPLVMLTWLELQCTRADAGAAVRALMTHAAFSLTNPNACYSLFGAFARCAPAFHAPDGSGYAQLAGIVRQLDAINPQVAARIVTPLTRLQSYDARRAAQMRAALQGLAQAQPPLSANTAELVHRSLA